MFKESRLVIALLLVMTTGRFAIAALGYFFPAFSTQIYGFDFEPQDPVWYFVRVWAGRDMIISLLVLTSRRDYLVPLLVACIGVEISDLVSSYLAYQSGALDADHYVAQLWTIIAPALAPETLALLLILRARAKAARA